MKGYKAVDQNMRAIRGNNMQFELGKTYSVSGEVVLCKNGFHFCEKIEYISGFYDFENSRIFEVEASGVIKSGSQKYAAERIEIVRELTKEEISEYFKQNAQALAYNNEKCIRYTVAKQGYGLDILVHDSYFPHQ